MSGASKNQRLTRTALATSVALLACRASPVFSSPPNLDAGTPLPYAPSISPSGVVVQLTWLEGYGDLDLHYVGPQGSFLELSPTRGDLCYFNAHGTDSGDGTPSMKCGVSSDPACSTMNPDWGLNGTVAPDGIAANDPSLDVDQLWGLGPETMTHAEPFDGTFTVTIHYYCAFALEAQNEPEKGPATAVVKVFANGTLAWTGQMAIPTDHMAWDAAQVVVSSGGTNISVVPLTTGVYGIGEGCP